jgi:two-component system, chemotaxis family, CheB/CheR fusion protein
MSDQGGSDPALEALLRSTIDDLEATSEQLRAANEELQTANEQLQAANEALEAANEALQDANAELEAMEAVLGSLAVAVVVVDGGRRVRVWNRGAEELWGIRPEEAAGRDLLALVPGDGLAGALHAVLSGAGPRERFELEAVAGRRHAARALPLTGAATGAIVLVEDRS